MRREFEAELKQKSAENSIELQKQLDTERSLRIEAERQSQVMRTTLEDTQLRVATVEDSRDRLSNQLRALEINFEPSKKQIENLAAENLKLKEDMMNQGNKYTAEINTLR